MKLKAFEMGKKVFEIKKRVFGAIKKVFEMKLKVFEIEKKAFEEKNFNEELLKEMLSFSARVKAIAVHLSY